MNVGWKASDKKLVSIWAIQASIVLTCCLLNPNHFTTIDSHYYLDSAQSLLDRDGYSHLENGVRTWNSTFPPGYPVLIAIVSLLTSLPVLWASKVLNLLSSGLWLWELRKWYGSERAMITGSLLLLGPFLKLWCHSWSEPLFLVLLFSWVRTFFADHQKFLPALLIGIALAAVRYVGFFIVIVSLIMSAYWSGKNPLKAQKAWKLSLVWGSAGVTWFLINYLHSGEFYGGSRFGRPEPLLDVVILFGKGLFNELLLFGDTNWQPVDAHFILEVLLQSFLLLQMEKGFRKLPRENHFLFTAVAYLIFLFLIRIVSPFGPPGYRLLAPFSFLIGWSWLFTHSGQVNTYKSKVIYRMIILFSWLHLLPPSGGWEKVHHAWEKLVAISPSIP
jgi:hypothetical protein